MLRKATGTLLLFYLLLLLLFALLACDAPSASIGGTASPTPNDMPANAQLNQWYTITNGVQVRYEDWKTNNGADDTVTIARFDPQDITLSVGYEPNSPHYASEWMQQEHALAIINGGYFDADDDATALVISNGQVWGDTYVGFGGMLWANAQGKIGLRSLRQQPYNPGEAITQAIQSSPTLILNGKRTQFNADTSQNRRSVVAMDMQGRLLFIASPGETFSLDQLADLLASSDLSISIAINLDGGASTGLYIDGGSANSQRVAIESLVRLPLVIIVKRK
jgi:exopolysaccharide biosynthesis protein